MTVVRPNAEVFELADPAYSESALSSYSGFHALAPALIGLAIPLSLFVTIQPDALHDTRFIVTAILLLIAVCAAAIFVMTLLNPGTTLAVKFDPASRVIEVIRSGTFAHVVYNVPFQRVVAARIETHYDDDGYAVNNAMIVLQPREIIELPSGTTQRDIAFIKSTVGLP